MYGSVGSGGLGRVLGGLERQIRFYYLLCPQIRRCQG